MRSTKLPSWIERLAGLEPQPAPPHVFVIDRDRLAYGLCRVEDRPQDRFVLESYESVELSPDLFTPGLMGGAARDEDALRNAIRALLGRLGSKPARATLVLPDSWLRLAFAETGELPTEEAARTQVMRWLLKRVVPFRVDELRITGVPVAPIAGQEQPQRLLLGFALEEVLAQLEKLFAAEGVRIGRIVNVSLALLSALSDNAPQGAITGLALVDGGGYTLLFAKGGEPVLHRYKAAEQSLPFDAQSRLVERDLKLTRTFLDEQLPEVPLDRVLLLTDESEQALIWSQWLESGLGARIEELGEAHLASLANATPIRHLLQVAPLLGASRQEVA